MAKKISSKLVIGNALISTNRSEITKKQIYMYWSIVDELLPNDYYTYESNNSFEDFCEEYKFLVKSINDVLILDCDPKLLERYCRMGLPMEIVNVFDLAGTKFNEIESQLSNETKNNDIQNFTVLAVPCNKAFVVSPEKADEFKNKTNSKKDDEFVKKVVETFRKNNLIDDGPVLKKTKKINKK